MDGDGSPRGAGVVFIAGNRFAIGDKQGKYYYKKWKVPRWILSIFKVGDDRILSRIRRDSRECSTINADPRKSSGANRAL